VRLLLVEADPAVAGALADELRGRGYGVDVARSGVELLGGSLVADLVLPGLELPDLDGPEVCRRLRAHSGVPIIALSGRDSELDRVLGFQAGLDDYVTRPFQVRELVARIAAVMRRVRGPAGESVEEDAPAPDTIVREPLRISLRAREVSVADRPIAVTPKEFDLLVLLASEPDSVFSRSRIMSEVWNDTSGRSSRTIDTHVGALRAKLGARSWVVTVHGIGFRLGQPTPGE
jgi:DNA-binding response OmpR family regulator